MSEAATVEPTPAVATPSPEGGKSPATPQPAEGQAPARPAADTPRDPGHGKAKPGLKTVQPEAPAPKAANLGLEELQAQFRAKREASSASAQEATPTPAAPVPSEAPAKEGTPEPAPAKEDKPDPREIRIHKLVDEKKKLEERLAQLEAQSSHQDPADPADPEGRAPASPTSPSEAPAQGEDILLQPAELQEVNAQLANLAALKAELHKIVEDGGELKLGDEIREITAEQAQSYLDAIGDERTSLVARRSVLESQAKAAYHQQAQQAQAVAHQLVPELADKNSPEAQWAASVYQQIPEVRKSPYHQQFMAWALLGQRAALAAQAATQSPAPAGPLGASRVSTPAAEPPPVVTQAAAPPVDDPAQVRLQQAQSQFERTGSVRDLAALNKAKREARQAA